MCRDPRSASNPPSPSSPPAGAAGGPRAALLLVLLVVALVFPSSALAEQDLLITITDVDLTGYPDLTAVVQVGGAASVGAAALSASDITLDIDGTGIEGFSLDPSSAVPLPSATVLLMDESGSMKGTAVDAAVSAARRFVEAMRDVDSVAIHSFNDGFRVLHELSSDRTSLAAVLDDLAPARETAMYDALIRSVAALDGVEGVRSRYVVLLSDGGDTASRARLEEALAAVRAASVQVYAVGLKTSEFDAAPLAQLAEATGGRYLETPDPAALGELYASLARELQNQFTIGFTVPEGTARSGAGLLTVRATLAGEEALGSHGFLYPEGVARTTAPEQTEPPTEAAADPAVAGAAAEVVPPPVAVEPGVLQAFIGWSGSDYTVALLVCALLFLALYVAAGMFFPRRDLLEEYSDILENRRNLAPRPVDRGESSRPIDKVVGRLLSARGYGDPLQRRIEDVGWRLRTSEFVLLQLSAVLVASIATAAVGVPFLLGVAVVLVVALAPLVYLDRKARLRREAFEAQVPDVLTLMASSLRAGQGFEQALRVVADEGADPSAHEFKRLLAQQRLGVPPEETLNALAARMQSEAFDWVVLATAIQREVGGNLAEVYTNIADTLRQRENLRREVRTLTAEGRFSAAILVLLPFGVGFAISIFNAEYLTVLYTTRVGVIVVAGALVMMIAGTLWIRRIIRFDI